jgi:hypothetical protein
MRLLIHTNRIILERQRSHVDFSSKLEGLNCLQTISEGKDYFSARMKAHGSFLMARSGAFVLGKFSKDKLEGKKLWSRRFIYQMNGKNFALFSYTTR